MGWYFEFSKVYQEVVPLEHIRYCLEDGRQVEVIFISLQERTKILTIIENDRIHHRDFQHAAWQSVLDHFTEYVETRFEKSSN